MSTFLDLDDEIVELAAEIAKKLGVTREDAVTIALTMMAVRMRFPIVEDK